MKIKKIVLCMIMSCCTILTALTPSFAATGTYSKTVDGVKIKLKYTSYKSDGRKLVKNEVYKGATGTSVKYYETSHKVSRLDSGRTYGVKTKGDAYTVNHWFLGNKTRYCEFGNRS